MRLLPFLFSYRWSSPSKNPAKSPQKRGGPPAAPTSSASPKGHIIITYHLTPITYLPNHKLLSIADVDTALERVLGIAELADHSYTLTAKVVDAARTVVDFRGDGTNPRHL